MRGERLYSRVAGAGRRSTRPALRQVAAARAARGALRCSSKVTSHPSSIPLHPSKPPSRNPIFGVAAALAPKTAPVDDPWFKPKDKVYLTQDFHSPSGEFVPQARRTFLRSRCRHSNGRKVYAYCVKFGLDYGQMLGVPENDLETYK
ncbi:hypothetical protein HYPSUDRAFT_76790 [Hypholoma sublateritium FD-334 SS-4]|uniref:Uncharacterized protein n=1 Tax=Hypholoma sublateritium (strain FD-334 SS-4) TaxID=945553 RepID=A0A0D2P5I5_HYPSF|nr:hypothetical protein HYPSUDRAFT_76790 [Hypholoma sublateritium FD-334 SS-4]